MTNVLGLPQLQARLKAIQDTAGLLRELQLDTVKEAKDRVPRKTGNLGRTIRPGNLFRDSAIVKAGGSLKVGYAAFVELGTRPHDIRPKRGRVLAWGGDRRLSGRLRSGSKPTHFARKVHHPGTRARPYLYPGARAAITRSRLADQIVAKWNGAA